MSKKRYIFTKQIKIQNKFGNRETKLLVKKFYVLFVKGKIDKALEFCLKDQSPKKINRFIRFPANKWYNRSSQQRTKIHQIMSSLTEIRA
ncbi:hypothetical protein RCL_jg27056.t1 [Rhizophagus clarus]|uniref:Uncharacterized protein n=1 Tax=Rhizophagus clarus TaxID=94130 RepID=A0A8H3MBJ3_9GLOM|nr:hypothetical protein RCL_jg27056.t1 [Rhizophagus clarus]